MSKQVEEMALSDSNQGSTASIGDENKTRGNWGRQIEFTLSCIGYAVGLGNLWRFPYLCMRNGGGAFLIPYFLFLFLCGMPLYFMELCMGQFSSLSPLSVWKMCPLFKGVGWGMIIVSAIFCIYYNLVIAWSLYYLGMSFQSEVPWKTCNNPWNTENCTTRVSFTNDSLSNYSSGNATSFGTQGIVANVSMEGKRSAAEEFWMYNVLDISEGIDKVGPIRWQLAVCLLAAWIIVYLCLFKSIKSSGKVVYVSATVPYLFLTILLVRGVTLPGSYEGIRFYLVPEWERLLEFKVWTEACLQIFHSLGPAWGGLITMASYNRFNHNCLRDAVVVCLVCSGTSFFAGFVIFSVIGFMAFEAGLPVDKVITQGPGLAFVAYPEAIANLPISSFWAVCFFLMLVSLGLDSQFGVLETVTSGFIDEFPSLLRKRKYVFVGFVCVFLFLVGLPLVTKGGMYIFQIMDWYAGVFSVVVIAFFECIVISYIYGIGRFYHDITIMLRWKPSYAWAVCWCFVTPCLLVMIFIVSVIQMVPPTYGNYEYPPWAITFGWILAILSIIPIPIVAIYRLGAAKGTLYQRLTTLLHPKKDWGPVLEQFRKNYKYALCNYPWVQRMKIHQPTSEQINGKDVYNLEKCDMHSDSLLNQNHV